LLLPDRRGNQRIDSLLNLTHDPRMALLFLIPGCGEALRANGQARISASPELASRFVVQGQAPAAVLVITVATVFFQCARAIKRSGLWDPARHVAAGTLPSPGAILECLSQARIDGSTYDAALRARQRATLY
jgi:PPOX class probable FMN-dependent enzyme